MRHRKNFQQYGINWDGYSGLRVEDLHSKLQLGLIQGKNPNMIFIHVGGNNITNSNQCKIIRLLKTELLYLFENFPDSLIIWIFILPRLSWSRKNQSNEIEKKCNNKRKTVNRKISNFVLSFTNGRSLMIKNIDDSMFHTDKVHLSDVGYELLIFNIGEAIADFLSDGGRKFISMEA